MKYGCSGLCGEENRPLLRTLDSVEDRKSARLRCAFPIPLAELISYKDEVAKVLVA